MHDWLEALAWDCLKLHFVPLRTLGSQFNKGLQGLVRQGDPAQLCPRKGAREEEEGVVGVTSRPAVDYLKKTQGRSACARRSMLQRDGREADVMPTQRAGARFGARASGRAPRPHQHFFNH